MSEATTGRSAIGKGGAVALWFLATFIPLAPAASLQLDPEAAWKEARERIASGDHQGAVPLLADLARREGFERRAEAEFLLGVALYRQQRWQEAIGPLEAAATELPLLADYALYYAAMVHQALGQRTEALSRYARLLQDHPDSLLAEQASRQRAYLYLEADQPARAVEAFREYLSRASDAARRREAMLALAEGALKEGRRGDAETFLRQLWLTWPESQEAARAGELLASMGDVRPFTTHEQFERALTLYRGGEYGRAVAALSPFLASGSPHAWQARLLSGISRFHLREYGQAIALLSELVDAPPTLRAEALYWIGRSYGRMDERAKAIGAWGHLVRAYPRSPWADDALYLMALTYVEDGNAKAAVRTLSRLLRDFPSSEFREAALWMRAWIAYRASALREALHDLRRLEQIAAPASRYKVQAAYWRGRVLEQIGRRREATQAYQRLLEGAADDHQYYAEQARLRLSRLAPSRQGAALAAAATLASVAAGVATDARESPAGSKARLLKELSLRDEASEEFWALARRDADDPALLYEACRAFLELGRIERTLWIAKRFLRPLYLRSRPNEPVPGYWRFLYPLGYWDLVRGQSARYALDPYLVVAVIREESAFGERAVSRAGAVGLMQLLPRTAEQIGRTGGLAGETADLVSPLANIGLGTRYLSQLLEEFQGNWARALAAYNAGPHQVRRWLDTRGRLSDDEFIEEIPFPETRAYVKRVLGSYYRYRAQYGRLEQTARSG
jgi:soluble lytic murein transglycosylase